MTTVGSCSDGGGDGDGYVDLCEQALDAKNDMVMAASNVAVAAGGDKNTSVITATTVKNRVLPLSSSELDGLKDYTLTNIKLIENLNMILTEKNEKIVELTNEVIYLKHKWDQAHQRVAELEVRNESLDALPFTPVSSTWYPGMGDLSSVELTEKQEVKPKKRRGRPVVIKQLSPDPIETNQAKRQKTRSYRAKSVDLGKIQEASLITSNSMGDLSFAELHKQREMKPKKRRGRPIVIKQPSPDPIETNLEKRQKTKNYRAKSVDLGKIQEASLITSNSMGDLSSVELTEKQEVKPKKRRGRPVMIKQPSPDPIETNLEKRQKTRNYRAKSVDLGKIQEASLITSNSMGDLSSVELTEKQEVKPKKRRGRPVMIKQPSPDPLETNLAKQQKTISYGAKSVDLGKIQEASLITSNSMGDLISAKLYKQQEMKPKKRRGRPVVIKQPSPDPLETNLAKRQKTKSYQANSADLGKMQEVSLITSNSMGDMSSAELPKQQEVKPKKRRGRPVMIKQPSPGPLETNQAKRQKTRSYGVELADLGKMQNVSLITSNSLGDLSSADLPEQEVKPKKRRGRPVMIKQPSLGPLESNQAKRQKTRSYGAESADLRKKQDLSLMTSNCMGDLSSAELPKQEVKPKKRSGHQDVIQRPDPDPLETKQATWKKVKSNQAKSADLGKMQEVSLITTNEAYYTCLGNYDPIKDDPEIPQVSSKKGNLGGDVKNLEIPGWRIKSYSTIYTMEGTENMSDEVYENRHAKLEIMERKQQKWDMQRFRELRQIECLKEGRNKHHSQNSKKKEEQELKTLLPSSANIKAIEITECIPVSAFGSNLYVKKKPESFKFFQSQWYNDGSSIKGSQEKKKRELRSSARGQFNDTT